MESKIKHLEFIQTTINRMANNSFLLKGWAITLIGSLIALSFKELDRRYLYISLIILGLFWSLDSYYLSRERNFIQLYNYVRKRENKEINFSMETEEFRRWLDWLRCTFSKTLRLFYGVLLAVVLLINSYL